MGWYTGSDPSTTRLRAYRQAGVRLLVGSIFGDAETRRWLATMHHYALKTFLNLDPTWVLHGDRRAIVHYVRAFQHDRSLYAWHLFDEPDFNHLSPGRLAAAYRIVKSVDPLHPVAVNFMSGDCRFGPAGIDPRFLAGFDLLMFDRYPFYRNMPGVRPVNDVRTVTRNCVSSARLYGKAGPVMVLQAFGRDVRDGPFLWRDPTPQELSAMVGDVKTAGAQGILFYSDQYADGSLWRAVQRVVDAAQPASSG